MDLKKEEGKKYLYSLLLLSTSTYIFDIRISFLFHNAGKQEHFEALLRYLHLRFANTPY